MGDKITNIFSPKSTVLAFAPLEPDSANPILREIMGINGAILVFRPKVLPQHLLKAKKWQFLEKIHNITDLKTIFSNKVFDILQLILRIDDPLKPALDFINNNAWEIGVSGIDLNFSCPGYKVIPQRRGGELLQDPGMIYQIIEKTLKYAELPVSIKIRKGYTANQNPNQLCKNIAKEFGKNITWISINRAPVRMGGVDMRQVEDDIVPFQQATESVDGQIPIIANGAIDSLSKLELISQNTKVNGIMLGRPALGNQGIFQEFDNFLCKKPNLIQDENSMLFKNINQLFDTIKSYHKTSQGMWTTIGHLKKLLFWYLKKNYEKQGLQLPAGYGFTSWTKKQHTIESFIQSLSKGFPQISADNWKKWLEYLF